MRYSPAVASQVAERSGRKASARSHAERTVAAEFRAYREQAQVISGNPPGIAACAARPPYRCFAPLLSPMRSRYRNGAPALPMRAAR